MSDRPRCGGFFHFNSHRWSQEKAHGKPDKSFREFTNESGNLWRKLSNLEQSVWDQRASHTPFCHEKARRKGLTEAELEAEDCQECLSRCEKLKMRSDKLAQQAQRLEKRAADGAAPLSPYFEFAAKKKVDYPGMNPIARAKVLGKAWRELTSTEKLVYETPAYREWREKKYRGSLSARLKKKPRASASSENEDEE